MRTATSNGGSSDNAEWEAAMNAELRSSARRTGCAGARRELCLTERSQQCQSGPKAWKHDLHSQGESDACRRGNVETRAWHRRGTCGKHCQSCMERVAGAGGTAGARAGCTAWTTAGSTAEAGPSYRSCTASPQRRRCVTVPSLTETVCELQMTRTNLEA